MDPCDDFKIDFFFSSEPICTDLACVMDFKALFPGIPGEKMFLVGEPALRLATELSSLLTLESSESE